MPSEAHENILKVSKREQYRTADELFEKSQSNSVYYTLLMLSTVIISCGLILGNSAIIIGGMLVTPLLNPVLTVALGMAAGELSAVRYPLALIAKSIVLMIGMALLLGFIFHTPPEDVFVFDNTVRSAVLYFLIAMASGVVASFAWSHEDLSDALPGTAIAVSVVPPLCLVGLWLSVLNIELARYYFFIFLLNFFGVLVGGLLVFTFLKFYRIEKKIEKIEEQQEKERAEKKDGKTS